MAYARSEAAFFHHDETKKAIVKIASYDRIVIYCGAGVTIDRTGLTWADLIAQLFETSEKGKLTRNPTPREVEILREQLTPLQLASICAERAREHYGSEAAARTSLVPKMQQALYKGTVWQSGALVSNIIRLAFGLIQLGRHVCIVTSNYDTYLEREYEHYRRELESNPDHVEIAGLVARAPGMNRPFKTTKPKGAVGNIEIIYLHGRIPPAGSLGGHLALSENDYSQVAATVVGTLEGLFRKSNTGILMLGTSLADPPLLRALSNTRRKSGPRATDGRNRVALVPVTSTGFSHFDSEFNRLAQHLRIRTQHFDVELLIPDFHFQIAQFCQEVLTAVSLRSGPHSYLAPGSSARYGSRLVRWWQDWIQQVEYSGPQQVFSTIRTRLDEIKEFVRANDSAHDPSDELLKIEFWVRHNPGERSRRLALWASSAGILHDRSILRTEDLRLNTRSASVRAFIEGRPQYTSLSDLTDSFPEDHSRWRAFLSVPIRIELQEGMLPVGVITLASMREKSNSGIPEGSLRDMENLIEQLTALGHELLQT